MNKRDQQRLRTALGIGTKLWPSVIEAAADCHMDVRDYCRLMVLVAAGHGGVIEHAERAAKASWDAETTADADDNRLRMSAET